MKIRTQKENKGEYKMQRKVLSNLSFLLAILLIFGTGCTKKKEEIEQPIQPEPTIIGKDSAEMILIPAGEFIMGSPEDEGEANERPRHTVFLDDFYIDKYEVTNAQYEQFMEATEHRAPKYWGNEEYKEFNQPDHPVVGVSWHDAVAYAAWAGKRLPTEAEWEKAARGTDGRKYPWGNEWDSSKCNSKDSNDGYEYTAPVDRRFPSFPSGASPYAYGVMDMAGNVWELCADWYDNKYYRQSPKKNPKGPDSGSMRVLRGGAWIHSTTYFLRCAFRYSYGPTSTDDFVGFRCAQDL
jgi:iron(II)-dependent oxidoreductase